MKRDFLTLADLRPDELRIVLARAAVLKAQRVGRGGDQRCAAARWR